MKTKRLLALLMTVAMLLSLLGPATALADDEVTFDEPDVIELPDGDLLEEDGEGLLSGLSTDLVTEDIDPAAVTEEVKPVYCTVSFDAQGGQPAPEAQVVEAGGFAAKPDDPTLEGHAFTGWFLDGADYFADPTPVTGDVTLTAGWEAVPQEEPAEEEPAEEVPQEEPAEEEPAEEVPQEEEEIPEGEFDVESTGEDETPEAADATETTEAQEEPAEAEQPVDDSLEDLTEELEAVTEESMNAEVLEADAIASAIVGGETKYYDSLEGAIDNADENGSVMLLKDVTLTATQTIRKSLTLNLNGHTITGNLTEQPKADRKWITVEDGQVWIMNGTISGRVNAYDNANLTLNQDLTINGQVIVWGDEENGKSPTLNVNGKIINNNGTYAISTNGTDLSEPMINIHQGATVESDGLGIYHPSNGQLNIYGGTITGKTAVYIKSGYLYIGGGTLVGNGAKAAYSYNGNGGNPTGDALVVDNCGYPGSAPNVWIGAGTFESTNNQGIGSYYDSSKVDGLAPVSAQSDSIKIHSANADADWHEVWLDRGGSYQLVQMCVVRFEPNNGENPIEQEVVGGEYADEPDEEPERTGYEFTGWLKDDNSKFDFYTTKITGNITLHAGWEPITYTVWFEGWYGEESQEFKYDEEKKLTANSFTREGYIFTGWNTRWDGKGTSYTDEQEVKNLSDENDGEVWLYAQWKPITYTVAFNANGGTGTMAKQSFTYGDGQKLSKNQFTNGSKYFDYWSTDENGEFDHYDDESKMYSLTTKDNEEVTLYAQWSDIGFYHVEYNENYPDGSSWKPKFYFGYTYTIDEQPDRYGYTFVEWNTKADGTGTSYKAGDEVKDLTDVHDSTVTLYAQWKANQYTVTFDANGGTGTMAKQTFTFGVPQKLSRNQFTNGKLNFDGWSTIKEYDGEDDLYSDEQLIEYGLTGAPNGEVVLYAQWTNDAYYRVKFNANGGSGDMDSMWFDFGETQKLDENEFTRDGYTFVGWNTKKDGSGKAYKDKEAVKDLSSRHKETVILYAQWKASNYTVVFIANDAMGKMANQSFELDKAQALTANAFTKEGYTFVGWNTKADGSGKTYKDKEAVKNLPEKEERRVLLYAQWKVGQYTITFDTDGGSKIDAIKQDFGTEVKAPKDPTKAGYTFKGWSPALPKTMPGKDLTVKAQWAVDQYTITFDTDGGSAIDAVKLASGAEVKAPAAPTKTGYTFQGWSPELPKAMPAKDMTVKAQWKANGYTVAFDKNGGTGAMAAESFTYDAEKKLTANAFKRSGYTFTGWNTKADGSGKAYADKQGVKNLSAKDGATVTLYAQWSKNATTTSRLMLATVTASGRTAMRVKWTKVKGADGYDVFMSKCGASEFRRVGSVKASASRVVTVRKLERSTEYKFYVKAWTRKNGKKTYIVTSPTAHALTGGANARYTNPSKVSVKRSSYTLKVGKTATIRATVTGLKKGKEVLNHVGLVRYITSNAKVAKVNSKGKIVAKGKGTCTIYVIATNGVYAKVKVTVK